MFSFHTTLFQVRIAAEEDEIKKQYWNILKKKYFNEELMKDTKMKRKLRIIKERGTNVQMPQSKVRVTKYIKTLEDHILTKNQLIESNSHYTTKKRIRGVKTR